MEARGTTISRSGSEHTQTGNTSRRVGTPHALFVATTLSCWGNNANGQLGTGDTSNRYRPTLIGSASDWASVVPGSSHTCGVRLNHVVYCWGYNGYGEIGDVTTTRRLLP